MRSLLRSDPESIGPFKLAARLGSGGMGIVYLATRGSHSVALKVLNPGSLDVPEHRGRFLRETDALRSISSPNVAKVIDAGTDGDLPWLAVEFINGPDLRSWVEDRGPLSGSEWLALAEGLLQGLVAIHEKGLIHRDIKPANILMSESGPKIIDFGIAQDLDATSVTVTGTVAGSPAWLSPEQIDGDTLTPASDLFSFGSVLAFAATGQSPWGNQSTTTSVVFNRILNKEPSLDEVSEAQRLFIERLLVKNPSDRPSSKKALTLLPKTIDVKDLRPQLLAETGVKKEKKKKQGPRTNWLSNWRARQVKASKSARAKIHPAARSEDKSRSTQSTSVEVPAVPGSTKNVPKPIVKPQKDIRARGFLSQNSANDPKISVNSSSPKQKRLGIAGVVGVVVSIGIVGGVFLTSQAIDSDSTSTPGSFEWIPKANPKMPDFKGKPLSEVKDYLLSIGINRWMDVEVSSDLPPGRVASTLPRAGEIVDVSYWNSYKTLDSIEIFVSEGSPTVQDSRMFTAGGTFMAQTGSQKENGNWGFYEPTIANSIMKIPVDVTFRETTKVFMGYDCSIVINETFERGCGLPRYDTMNVPKNVLASFPFEISLEGGIKKPKAFEISFKIQDSKGLRDMKLSFTVEYWD